MLPNPCDRKHAAVSRDGGNEFFRFIRKMIAGRSCDPGIAGSGGAWATPTYGGEWFGFRWLKQIHENCGDSVSWVTRYIVASNRRHVVVWVLVGRLPFEFIVRRHQSSILVNSQDKNIPA